MRRFEVSDDEGFSLIELLVVVIIIGVLAGIAIPVFIGQRSKGYDAAAKSDLRNAATAEETYLTDYNSYTTVNANLISAGYKASPNVTLTVISSRGTSGTGGFCLSAVNNKGGSTWYYDSAQGGLQTKGTTCT